jgi:hypothetical protein
MRCDEQLWHMHQTTAFGPKTVIRGVDVRSIEDTAVIELLLTRPERKVER